MLPDPLSWRFQLSSWWHTSPYWSRLQDTGYEGDPAPLKLSFFFFRIHFCCPIYLHLSHLPAPTSTSCLPLQLDTQTSKYTKRQETDRRNKPTIPTLDTHLNNSTTICHTLTRSICSLSNLLKTPQSSAVCSSNLYRLPSPLILSCYTCASKFSVQNNLQSCLIWMTGSAKTNLKHYGHVVGCCPMSNFFKYYLFGFN